jgi:hypothetical protein
MSSLVKIFYHVFTHGLLERNPSASRRSLNLRLCSVCEVGLASPEALRESLSGDLGRNFWQDPPLLPTTKETKNTHVHWAAATRGYWTAVYAQLRTQRLRARR